MTVAGDIPSRGVARNQRRAAMYLMSDHELRPRLRALVWLWAVLALSAIYIRGPRIEIDRQVTNRLQYHAIPVAISVLFHGHPHDYTALTSIARTFQDAKTDVEVKIIRTILNEPPADDTTYYWAADDRGMADYVIAAFRLFGPSTKSLYKFYFVVLAASVVLFLADLAWAPIASALLLLVLGGIYACTSVIPLGNLTLPIFEPSSIYEPRIVELLAYVATLHLALTPFFSARWSPARRAIVAMQAAILVACYHMRSSVGWEVSFILMLNVACWIWRHRHQARAQGDGALRPTMIAATWPSICLAAGLVLLFAYHRVAFNPRYFRDMGSRVVWHNALMGLSFNAHLREKYRLAVDDRAVVNAVRTYLQSTNDPRLTVEWNETTILNSLGGHTVFDWFAYEGAGRDLYRHIWRSDPGAMLRLYTVDKPAETIRVIVKAFQASPDSPGTIPDGMRFNPFSRVALLIVLPAIVLMWMSGGAIVPTLSVVLFLFACSVVPGIFFYPVVYTMMGAFATVALAGYLTVARLLLLVEEPARTIGGRAIRTARRGAADVAVRGAQALGTLRSWFTIARQDVLYKVTLAALTLAVAAYFAPRGFRAGFTDVAHDGYQLRQILDLDAGGTIFKDTFDQYGPLSGYVNLAGFRMFGRNLLAAKYAISVWYAATAVLLYVLARSLLTPGLAAVSVLVWLGLAPFYGHGVMISPHAYVLFLQTAATLAILWFAQGGRRGWLAFAGLCCGLCWALKTSLGLLFAAGVTTYFVVRVLTRKSSVLDGVIALSVFLGAGVAVVAGTLGLLALGGALHDWYLQTIVFPKQFYLDQVGPGGGGFSSIGVFMREFIALNFDISYVPVAVYWHLMRFGLIAAVVVLWRRQRPIPELLLLTACLLPLLWLGAFPSANFMHQWWLTSLGIAPFVYCADVAVGQIDMRWFAGRYRRLEWVATGLMIGLIFSSGFVERARSARERAATLTETIDVPPVLKGIRTDKNTLTAFRILYAAISNYKQHHPSARIVSRDHCQGYNGCVPESLLMLSFLEDNRHDHPVYWPMPVLTTTIYPEYRRLFARDLERTQPLVVDSWDPRGVGNDPPNTAFDRYELLVGAQTDWNYWYLFAPTHGSAASHGEVHVQLGPPPQPRVAATEQGAAPREETVPDEPLLPVATVALAAIPPPPPKLVKRDRTVVVEGEPIVRRLETWPEDAEVTRLSPTFDPVDPSSAGRADIVTFRRRRWVVRGTAEDRFSYLMYFKERTVRDGEYFLATGELHEGGLSFGLQIDEEWIGLAHVTTRGPFAVVLKPDAGRYHLVLANNITTKRDDLYREYGVFAVWKILTGALLPTSFEIDRAGWTSYPPITRSGP